jgi:type IV pilus assembly protein PilC
VLVKLPYFGKLLTKLASARFSRTLGSLLISGVDIVFAMDVASRSTANRYVHTLLSFPKTLIRMTSSGEKTGQLGEMLNFAADFFESETNSELATASSLIEPVVIVILGAFIAFILVAMYLPLFELVGTI